MMKHDAIGRIITCSSVLCAMAIGLGCSSTAGSGQQRTAKTLSPVEVASISGAGVTLTFYSLPGPNGRPGIGMTERGSAYAKTSPIPGLVAQKLTSQEIYLALAPEGATAPGPLVEAQADQAAMLDRSADLRHVTIDRNAVVEKNLASCESGLEQPWNQSGSWHLWSAGLYTQGVETDMRAAGVGVHLPVMLGACDESIPELLLYWNGEEMWSGGGIWEDEETITPGYYYVYYWQWWVNQNGVAYGVNYTFYSDTQGGSGYFDQITGEWY